MRSARLAAPLALFLLASSLCAQSSHLLTVGGTDDPIRRGSSVCAVGLPDGGQIICYGLLTPGAWMDRVALGVMKLTADGAVGWNRMIEIPDEGNDGTMIDGFEPKAIAGRPDGSYAIAGQLLQGRDDGAPFYMRTGIALLVVDPNGQLLSYRKLDASFHPCPFAADDREPTRCEVDEFVGLAADADGIVLITVDGWNRHNSMVALLTHDGELVEAFYPMALSEEHPNNWVPRLIGFDGQGRVVIVGEWYERNVDARGTTITTLDRMGEVIRSRMVRGIAPSLQGSVAFLPDGRLVLPCVGLLPSDERTSSEESSTPVPPEDLSTLLLLVDSTAEHAAVIRLEGFDPEDYIGSYARLSDDRIVFVQARPDNASYRPLTGYVLIEPDGTYGGRHAIGVAPGLESHEGVVDRRLGDGLKGDDDDPRPAPGTISLDGISPGSDGRLLVYGYDNQFDPVLSLMVPGAPSLCLQGEGPPVHASTDSVAMVDVTFQMRWFDNAREEDAASIRFTQRTSPIELIPICRDDHDNANADAPLTPSDAGVHLRISEPLMRVGDEFIASFEVSPPAGGTPTFRVVEAESGRTMLERRLTTAERSGGRVNVTTDGWSPGVYVVSIEIGGATAVAKVRVDP